MFINKFIVIYLKNRNEFIRFSITIRVNYFVMFSVETSSNFTNFIVNMRITVIIISTLNSQWSNSMYKLLLLTNVK